MTTSGSTELAATTSIAVDADPAVLAAEGSIGGRVEDARAGRRRRKRRTSAAKRATIVAHRWTSLILGVVLVVITTAGAFVVYSPEWTRWTNSSQFDVTKSAEPISMTEAMKIVGDAHPDFDPGSVNLYSGLYEVMSSDDDAHPGFWGVDPGSGRITGFVNANSGVMAVMEQVHECFFTCDDYPAYISFLDEKVPTLGMAWLKDMTWSSFILGTMGVLLLFLALSGVWLWWPTIKRFGQGFRVRTKKGRVARDYDLHQVIGMAALPFLLVWGLTGASFEFHWVNTAWYAISGGEQEVDVSFASNDVTATVPDIGLDAAIAAGRLQARSDSELVYVGLPAADDPTSAYDLWFSEAFDQYEHGAYPGQFEVQVDRHDATHVLASDYGTAPTWSNKFLDRLGGATFHFGQSVNGWWRILWFLFGLTPLALALTAMSTWLAKRSARKRRRAVLAARAAASTGDVDVTSPADAPADAPVS